MSRELTREEKAAIRALVVKWCANYDREYGCLLGLGPPRKLYLRGERRNNGMSELSPQAEAKDMEFVTTSECYMLGKCWTSAYCHYFREAVLPLNPALEAIRGRMEEAGIRNMSAYIRKMALNGYILHVDLSPVQELVSLQRRCANNLNQVATHANSYGVYQEEIKSLQKDYADLWGPLSDLLQKLSEVVRL